MADDTSSNDTTVIEAEDGGTIEYVDLGDRTLVIDNTGDVQRREILPKSLRSVGVTPQQRQELEERIEAENAAALKAREETAEEPYPTESLPPVEDYDAIKEREAHAEERMREADRAFQGEKLVEVEARGGVEPDDAAKRRAREHEETKTSKTKT